MSAAMVLVNALARRVGRLTTTSGPFAQYARALSSATPTRSPPRVVNVEDLKEQRAVRVTWDDEFSAKFHKKWLRDHCTCPACLHLDTRQRQIDTASIPADPKMTALGVSADKSAVAIQWLSSVRGTSCTESAFDAQWLRDHAYGVEPMAYPTNHRQQTLRGKELWDGATLQLPRRAFADVIDDIRPVMEDLHRYGLAMVHSTPSSMDETERFSRKIGFVMETIYGKMWTTNPQNAEQEYNDTASTNLELLHHTDGTYMRDPPGLQIFNCIAQAGEGGASRYVDSFHLVETLRRENRAAFDFFSSTPLHYFTYDNDAHLATMEPLIKLDHAGNVVQFRHNDYDRAPLAHLSFDQVEQFYRYHAELLRLLRDPKMEFRVKLGVGDMILVDNQRVMHGRDAFEGGDRALIGCYIGRVEYESRLRVLEII